jgi:hypothetical protein
MFGWLSCPHLSFRRWASLEFLHRSATMAKDKKRYDVCHLVPHSVFIPIEHRPRAPPHPSSNIDIYMLCYSNCPVPLVTVQLAVGRHMNCSSSHNYMPILYYIFTMNLLLSGLFCWRRGTISRQFWAHVLPVYLPFIVCKYINSNNKK